MGTESRRVILELNPVRLASIINNAVVLSSEIVNFHFNALATADLSQPARAADARYRFQAPAMSAAGRHAVHERWILAKAFQELLRAVRHALELAYVFTVLLTGKHRTKSSGTLSEFLKPFERKAAGLSFPELLDAVNNKLEPKIDFSAAYVSLQSARNCLEHRDGVVTQIETRGNESFNLRIPRAKMFYLRNGAEVEIQPGHVVEPCDDRAQVEIMMKFEARERFVGLGERLSFTLAEFNEIAFACHFLGQQLSTKLPRPRVVEERARRAQ